MSLETTAIVVMQSATSAPRAARHHATGTHVRAIAFSSKEERHAAALLLTRSFATSTLMRYLGRVKRPGLTPPPITTSREGVAHLPSNARALYYFFAGMLTTTVLANGRPMVVVEPAPAPTADTPRNWLIVRASASTNRVTEDHAALSEKVGESSTSAKYERYLVVAQWLAPGERPDDIMTVLKSKHHRTMTGGGWRIEGWGVRGIWNALKIADVFQERHREACAARGIQKADCWTLEILGTDPESEGKGYGALATREGLEYIDRNRPGPCILETTELRAKAIYEHFGFQETSNLAVGSGVVDAEGFLLNGPKIGKASLDLTAWTMLRPVHST